MERKALKQLLNLSLFTAFYNQQSEKDSIYTVGIFYCMTWNLIYLFNQQEMWVWSGITRMHCKVNFYSPSIFKILF